jgi:hypothetical protein
MLWPRRVHSDINWVCPRIDTWPARHLYHAGDVVPGMMMGWMAELFVGDSGGLCDRWRRTLRAYLSITCVRIGLHFTSHRADLLKYVSL